MLISCAASLAAIWTLGGAELSSNRSFLSIDPYFWEIQVSQSELSGSMFRGIAVTAARRLRVSEEPKSRPSAVADGLGLGLPKLSPSALTDAASASSVMVGEQPHPLILLPLDSHSPNSGRAKMWSALHLVTPLLMHKREECFTPPKRGKGRLDQFTWSPFRDCGSSALRMAPTRES
jgi:hypothetical protein